MQLKPVMGILFLLGFAGIVNSADSGPHGGVVVSHSGQTVEVAVDPKSDRVEVFVLKRTKTFPGSIGISLRDRNGNSRTLELETSNPLADPIRYSTPAGAGLPSYVGFEIKIPFRKEKPLVLKSP